MSCNWLVFPLLWLADLGIGGIAPVALDYYRLTWSLGVTVFPRILIAPLHSPNGRQIESTPADTLRNNDVVITSKRRHFDVITSKWHRFDVITTLSLRHVFSGTLRRNTFPTLEITGCRPSIICDTGISKLYKGQVERLSNANYLSSYVHIYSIQFALSHIYICHPLISNLNQMRPIYFRFVPVVAFWPSYYEIQGK